jgi:hypothetical protein
VPTLEVQFGNEAQERAMASEKRAPQTSGGEVSGIGQAGESRPLKIQLSPALAFFREAVLRDPRLQDQLRDAGTCQEVAQIANDYLRTNLRVEVSADLTRSPLRGLADETFRNALRVTVEDLEQHMLYQTNQQGEVLLGESELAMVAGSTRVGGSSCYGCSCGGTCGFLSCR